MERNVRLYFVSKTVLQHKKFFFRSPEGFVYKVEQTILTGFR